MNNLIATAVLAADEFNLGGDDLGKFQAASDLSIPGMVSGFLSLILVIAALAFFFILVIGGIKWILSGGDKAHTEGARNQITAALVGLVIVFSAWAIVKLIDAFFGVNILQLDLPTAVGK
jgi:TRAP-type C4-dicarboxylate transport system permease small subunit